MASFKRIFAYLKPYKFLAIMGPLFMVLEVAMDLYQPRLMQNIIDIGIANRDLSYVLKIGSLMILIAFLGLFGGVMCIILSTKAGVNLSTDIRRDLYKKIQKFSGQNIDKFQSGKLITILTNDVNSIQMAVMMMLRIVVRAPLLFIGSIVMVFISAYELSPILLGVIPLILIVIILLGKRVGGLFKRVQEALDRVNTSIQENLSGIRVVKAFVREDYEIKKFEKVNENLTLTNIDAMKLISILIPIVSLIINAAMIAALWIGAVNVSKGTIQIGQIMAFLNYLIQILISLMMIAMIFVHITRAVPSMERTIEVLDTEITIKDNPNSKELDNIKGELEFKNVSYSYNEDDLVLKNINFKIESGSKVGIIGSTGSGKSTLVKLIGRLYDVSSGEILIDGVDVRDIKLPSLRKSIGMVPQKALLFSGTIEENIKYGKENAKLDEMKKAAKAACAMEFIDKFEDGFNYELTQKATNLSGGQKQRLSITRALVRHPSILILDDSTSAVDAQSERIIKKALEDEFSETTTFIIASKISSIINSNVILVLDDGELVGQGTHEELLNNCDVYKEIYLSQGGKEEENV
ncbi:ABC transporter ATP-binding protein [Clostridium tetani]|uniref:Multidrug resistance ABC transporter n=1 Tax=Clostridium tetani (strain Massachusetts / E88) TaxID=212717 RepID=Q898M0_CLOTE|nr:ABC transporter ATP-binding protein [Clostridium tetani]AAO35059.1 multidrug resistance ABC transporter [Clostridium tetani E88]KGI37445.1 multidrug ABC transporter ATP-binding protein [Clostridium tetani ATCC 9441]KGI40852.1 multidrug ABC transporter ATP-binding protein [Clostridium tetani]KGI44328.1 multidrug ABC transporter ATP-binding protein [Clostridium tetani]KHO38194.1 multidrug ABC transporter ATP-binding protein [Clostridium tetani]